MTSQHTPSAMGYTNVSSVASISEDLISHRGPWRKIIAAILCVLFVLSSWAVIIAHAVNFTNQTSLELTVSISVLICGQYVITGIVDAVIYWKRWNKPKSKRRTKFEEENKEAWVCMRVTLSLLGLAPIARYIESLVVIRRMIALEKRYMAETVAIIKEAQQPSTFPGGSLISAPITNQQSVQSKKSADILSNMNRLRELDTGLQRVRRVRRQFRRTENDSAIVALASGVAGAAPYLISQGVLFYRREAINFIMSTSTKLMLLGLGFTASSWISASLTHFYPVPYKQTELEFERGIGQIKAGGLILLFFVHYVHIVIRTFSFILFISLFSYMVLIVIGIHFVVVLLSLVLARVFTRSGVTENGMSDMIIIHIALLMLPTSLFALHNGFRSVWNSSTGFKPTESHHIVSAERRCRKRGDIGANFLSDLLFSYVGLFEFASAYAKYSRTRYLIYYFFYYAENAAMLGAWYAFYGSPEVWFYLPALLIVTLGQFLGFILLQVYLYCFSKSKRKTTVCGFCFAHRDPEFQPRKPVHKADSEHFGIESGQLFSVLDLPKSMLSGQSPGPNGSVLLQKRTATEICDPVFGEQISQVAAPLKSRGRAKPNSGRVSGKMTDPSNMSRADWEASSHLLSERALSRDLTQPLDNQLVPSGTWNMAKFDRSVNQSRERFHEKRNRTHRPPNQHDKEPNVEPQRNRYHHQRHRSDELSSSSELAQEPRRANRSTHSLLISAEEAMERELISGPPPPRHHRRGHSSSQFDFDVDTIENRFGRPKSQQDIQVNRSKREPINPRYNQPDRYSQITPSSSSRKVAKGVFQPNPDLNRTRTKWPYTQNIRN